MIMYVIRGKMKIGKKIVESGKKSYKQEATLDIFRELKEAKELQEIPDDFRYDIEKELIEVSHEHAEEYMKKRFAKPTKQKWTKNVVTGLKDRTEIFTKGANSRVALVKCDETEDIFEHIDSLISDAQAEAQSEEAQSEEAQEEEAQEEEAQSEAQ